MSQFLDCIRLPNSTLGIAKGQFQNISSIHKFGAVPSMSQNQTGTVWDVNNTSYPWSSFSSAGTLDVPSVNASDDGKSVVLVGLDSNYEALEETLTVSSSVTVTTSAEFIRIFRAYVIDGSDSNVGNINIQKGGTVVARITAGKSQTQMAIYTIPAGHSGYLLKGVATCQDGADATGDMFIRYFGQETFRVGHSFEVCGDGGEYTYEFGVPIRLPEKSDIDIRATMRSNNARLTAAFDLILDKDD